MKEEPGLPDVAALRQRRIMDMVRQTGSVSVEALAGELAVTPQTIRRDLNHLSRHAMLSRVHGGAVVTSGVDNLAHAARRDLAADAKDAIGAAAAALVPDGASLFINIGTTTEAIARHLKRHRDLLVITNNLNVVDILAGCPSIEVIAAGGRVRQADRAVVGALAIEFIKGFKVDFALVGASGLDVDGTLLDFDVDEVRVSQTVMAHARKVVLAMDATKIARPAPVRIAQLSSVDWLVTDRLSEPALQDYCRTEGVAVVEARG